MSTCIHAHVVICLEHEQYLTHVLFCLCCMHGLFIISTGLLMDRVGTNANLPVEVVRMIASQ